MTKTKAHKHWKCYRHPYRKPVSTCVSCGAKICAECAQGPFPHKCVDCYIKEYDSTQRKKLNMRNTWKRRGILIAIIAVISISFLIGMNWAIDKAIEDEPEKEERVKPPVPHVYLVDDDIYLNFTDRQYDQVNNVVRFSIKIYLTNNYANDAGNLQIELMILKNTTIRFERTLDEQSVGTIGSNLTKILNFENIQIHPGRYYATFVVWKDNRVYRKATITFNINHLDVNGVSRMGEKELNPLVAYPEQPEPEEINKPEVIKDVWENNVAKSIAIMIGLIFVQLLVVVLTILYKETTFEVSSPYFKWDYSTQGPPPPEEPEVSLEEMVEALEEQKLEDEPSSEEPDLFAPEEEGNSVLGSDPNPASDTFINYPTPQTQEQPIQPAPEQPASEAPDQGGDEHAF